MLKNRKLVNKFLNKIIAGVTAVFLLLVIYMGVTSELNIGETKKIGTAGQIEHVRGISMIGNGIINPIYKPEWKPVSSSLDTTNKTLSVVVKGKANKSSTIGGASINYNSEVTSTLDASKIYVYIDGELDGDANGNGKLDTGETRSITVNVSSPAETTGTEITHTITLSNLMETVGRRTGKNFTEWSGNVAIKIEGRGEDTTTYGANVLVDKYGNQNMMETDESGSWVDVTIKDGEIDHNTDGTMFTDFIGPEFTYEFANTVIDHGEKKVTIGFDITDKYFDTATLTANDITIVLGGVVAENATKTLSKTGIYVMNKETKAITTQASGYTVQSNEQKVGEKFELIVTNLDQGDANDYSGIMTLAFPAGIAKDKSNNLSVAKTITVGIDDPTNHTDHTTGQIVDVVDPVWTTDNLEIDKTNKQIAFDLIATDKYYQGNTLTESDILIYVDGVLAPEITRTLGTATAVTNGQKYRLTISNFDANDYSGTVKMVIPAGKITDQYTNTSKEQEFIIGHIDFTNPVITPISSTSDPTAKTETFEFKATDKFMDMSDLITVGQSGTPDEVEVYIDNELVTGVTKTITSEEITEVVNGVTVKGHKYTLVLSNLEQASQNAKGYKDYSGTVQIKVKEGAVKDTEVTLIGGVTAGGNLNEETTINGDFVDFIKPSVKYKYISSDVDYTGKSFEMVFDVTDKYYTSGELTLDDLTIRITNGQKDADGNVITYDLKNEPVTLTLTNTSKTATFNKTVSGTVTNGTYQIGHEYTLTIANLEQLEIKEGLTTADYSGIITVVIDQNKIEDNGPANNGTNTNGNASTTLTSGVDLPGGSGSGTVVDVVRPMWKILESDTDMKNKTATFTFAGTDTYFKTTGSTLTIDDIEVYVDGNKITSGITKTLSTKTDLTEQRMVNGTTSTVKYGEKYTMTLSGFSSDANQVKIRIPADKLEDQSGNKSQETDLIVYNVLKVVSDEMGQTAPFLENANLQRANIDNLTFLNNIPNTVINKTTKEYIDTTAWDVSAQQDKSILAWYTTNGNGTFQVYIGSDYEIFGNKNSSYLFRYIGGGNKCNSEETITNLNLLNVKNVTNMQYMFSYTGAKSMKKLDFGDDFDTSNVTNMMAMFEMTGNSAMEEFNLGNNFDTSKVTSMQAMFEEVGKGKLTTLDLGDRFDTSKVTNMSKMFKNAGYTSMTKLELGENFNTAKVTDMTEMFNNTGYTKMASLDLKEQFYTTKVTNMTSMFNGCGAASMTALDLGPVFTKIASTNTEIFEVTGKSGEITIYASEQIYLDRNNFKLDTNATESVINYTRGTINPKYRTEWVRELNGVSLNETNKTIAITLRGRTNAEAGTEYISDVTSSLTTDKIHIFFDAEEVPTTSTLTKTLGTATTVANAVTGKNDVLQVLTLSNIEEALRQTGKNFKEWSGNISLKIDKKTLTDTTYSNQNLQAIDTTGEMIDIELKDSLTNKNTANTMFTDYIKPEYTYEYYNVETDTSANTVIDYEAKKLTVVFDITDKYFESSNITAENTNILVDGENPDWTKVTKTLQKKTYAEDLVVGNITYKTNGDIYYTINGTPTKIGERYELIVTGLETEEGVGYSGIVTMSFPAGELNPDGTVKTGIVDKSGNLSVAKTITIGIDEPDNHPDHKDPAVVDVVNPLWTGPHNINTINRTDDTVSIIILGSDKYYNTDVFAQGLASGNMETALSKIKVYVDEIEKPLITKSITKLSNTELQAIITDDQADLQSALASEVKVGYTLTLGNFGDINGITKIVIEADTISDISGNTNVETTIPVGNIVWEELNEPLEDGDAGYPRYNAFRQDIVDFLDPVIKYQYSEIQVDTDGDGIPDTNIMSNPTINYEEKSLTVKFTVTDKYLVQSAVMNADGSLNTDNVKIHISTLNDTGIEEFKDITDEGITTTITAQTIENGFEYTLVVKDFEQIYNNKGNYMDYSGIVQLVFTEGQIDDTSGNKNVATTLTIDTGTGDNPSGGIVVDVINPIIEKTTENLSIINSNNTITRDKENETGSVTLMIKATDKYLNTATLQSAENVERLKVKIIKPDGTEVIANNIRKTVTQVSKQETFVTYRITLENFEDNEGITSIIVPEGVITDTSGNQNLETEILVGNLTWSEIGDSDGEYTAFQNSIVDFTMPVWEYSSSSITRNREAETGTVTVKILGSDSYYLKDTLTTNDISVYVANSENPDEPITTITKSLTKITDTSALQGADTGYYLTLGNFGTYDGQVKIKIASDTIKDTSGNGNFETEILVGNPNWVENDIGDSDVDPKYTAFRNSIVDFIKPIIVYNYSADTNPVIDQTNKQASIKFDAIDTNFLESTISVNDIQIFVDDVDVTNTLTKELTSEDITDGTTNGLRYTLKLSNFELPDILEGDTFKRHSGKVELVIASGKVKDTSGNENIETRIIVDNDNGDDEANYIKVDFINPKLYMTDKFISWDKRYAEITIAGTDRFYDFDTVLDPADISLYQLNHEGNYVQITDLPISITSVEIDYGYKFVIKLSDFEEEYKMKIHIPANKIADTEGHYNDETDIYVVLDNKKPVWKYESTDTSKFEDEGKVTFNVKGYDKFLDLVNSNLTIDDVYIYRDGTNITNDVEITLNQTATNETEISKSYEIQVTGLTEIGTYSLVLNEGTLIDEFDNESATTTISLSKSVIAGNTENYQIVTYHASPDFEQVHQAYVHELMSVNTTGTNFENTTFRPSTIGEIHNDGKNTLFAEPFEYSGGTQTAYSFKGWGLANEKGFIEDEANATIYGLYDEIPETAKADDGIVHLKAVWQNAKVIFVSNGSGNNSNDGLSPTTPVKDITTAYSKLDSSGTAETNIIVIMDAVEWNSSTKLTGNTTITSLYAGVDYRITANAELKISSNLEVQGDIKFDDIKLYSDSTVVSDGSDYLANGTYSNMLITNFGNITLGRRIYTPDGKYTFGAVIGGNYTTESKIGTIGKHSVIVETGKYNNIIVASALSSGSQTTKQKYICNNLVIGNMKDSAISRNDKLTITGYVSISELEDRHYAYNAENIASQGTTNAYERTYSTTKLYSGTFTGENKFTKQSEDSVLYLRSMNGFADGKSYLEMYGGNITGNVYSGSRMATTHSEEDTNYMNFYGGNITGNVFGHGNNDTSTGGSKITIEGCIKITGSVFGGSNATTEAQGKVTGNVEITINSSSATITDNIYGSGRGIIGSSINLNTGLITGNSDININSGNINGDIFGGGYNCGITGESDICIANGNITGNIYGGAYQNQVKTKTNIHILGGTINSVYGGNVLTTQYQQNNDSIEQDSRIIIEGEGTIQGVIYGGGKYDKLGTAEIELIACETTPTVFGGSDGSGIVNKVKIYTEGMTTNTIYGGPNGNGTVTESNIYLYENSTTTEVYGGGYGGTTTTANIYLNSEQIDRSSSSDAVVTSIYGGSNTSGTVTTSNVLLKKGNVTNVYGGGYSTDIETANVTLDGITIDTIHGGSRNTGIATNTNVILKSGKVTNAFGGGYDASAGNTNVTQKGATVTNIYGGTEGGINSDLETTNTTVNIDSGIVTNVYGGNLDRGYVRNSTINIRGNSIVTGELFGGGYRSSIGKSGTNGTTTINVSGGSIYRDIYGGSKDTTVYGTTNINIGSTIVTDSEGVSGTIDIDGDIYGGGYYPSTTFDYTGVYGNTKISLEDSTQSNVLFDGSIFGSGKGSNYSTNNTTSDESTVKIKNFGSASNSHLITSIQRTGKVYIGNSYLELAGAKDRNNYYGNTMFTLNRITNGLVLHDNSTIYTRRGFNMVGGFESGILQANGTVTKETITISGNSVTRNVDNRIYTLEGINLIFAKQEGDLANKSSQDIWADVKGMAFFGMYRINRTTLRKEYDIYAPNYTGGAVESFFANGTYIEGRHKPSHDTSVDGFYSNFADYSDPDNIEVIPQIIDVVDYGTYYDWIIGEDIVNYDLGPLIASNYSSWSSVELPLDYKYQKGATYILNRVSSNALGTDVNLVNRYSIPTIASGESANNTFGLTMSTTKSGWIQTGETNLYTTDSGAFEGNTVFRTDNTNECGTLIFKIFNSVNISETRDLGNMNIVLTGKTRTGESEGEGSVFRIIIALSLQAVHEDESLNYIPKFTDSIETELNYTTDSKIDLTYTLYQTGLSNTIYGTGDYRVLSSTVQLPAGTKITVRDYGQGNSLNKVYYYQVPSNTSYNSTETVDGKTRYLYKFSEFIEMDSALASSRTNGTNAGDNGTINITGTGNTLKFADNNALYYHEGASEGEGYALEKYEVSIDFVDSNINTNQLAQEIYLQLRASNGALQHDNGDKDLIFNLYNKNAIMQESISNEGNSYSVFENLSIPFTFNSSLVEQTIDGTSDTAKIFDTKYYDKKLGLAIEIVDENGARVKAPDVQNLKLTDTNDSTKVYTAGNDGVIRVPVADTMSVIENSYILSLSQYNVPAGLYQANVYFFTSDDGKYYGGEQTLVKQFNITFINRLLGLAGVESTNDSRIISKTTGLNLEGNRGLDLTVKVSSPTDDTNIRVELYKRNATYTTSEEGIKTYTGTQYTKVDLAQYLEGEWETPEEQGLVTPEGCTEYMVMPKQTYGGVVELKTVNFEKDIIDSIDTGEYKLVFKAYYNDTVIQTVTKTFIVTQ